MTLLSFSNNLNRSKQTMASNHQALLDALPRGVWMSSSIIDQKWGSGTSRKYRVQQLVKNGLLLRKGNTGNTMYKVAGQSTEKTKSAKSTTSAKSPNSLDSLIAAASQVGTENEILKTALKEAAAAIARGLEAIK
jgi:hypothetical protein